MSKANQQPEAPDPYAEFFRWCDANGFPDVGSGPVDDMKPERFDDAIRAYASAEPKVKTI